MTTVRFPTTLDWHGCYGDKWNGEATHLSTIHPAKFSKALIRRIYDFLLFEGHLTPGDTVLDPFGGVALGACYALRHGLNWLGCELEARFVDLGHGCDCTGISKADWVRFYGRWDKVNHRGGRHWCPECLAQAKQVVPSPPPSAQMALFAAPVDDAPSAAYVQNSGQIPFTIPHRYEGNIPKFMQYAKGDAQAWLVQGDSRQLLEVLAQAHAQGVVSSPPYAGSNQNYEAGWKYIDKDKLPHNRYSKNREASYGTSEGQLADMPPGEVDAVVSSPPWGTTEGAKSASKFRDPEKSAAIQEDSHRQPHMNFASKEALLRAMEKANGETYGDTPGNLGNMPAKESEWDAVVSSPPYGHNHKHDYRDRENDRNQGRGCWRGVYGRTDGQLTNMGEGDIEAVVSSPPYANSINAGTSKSGIDWKKAGRPDRLQASPNRHGVQGDMNFSYSDSEANLSNLSEGDFNGVITSPPYENSVNQSDSASDFEARKRRMQQAGVDTAAAANIGGSNSVYQQPQHYSHNENNLGTQGGDTFWSAARLIVEQCYLALADGGVAVWVCKDFVRNKKRVPFSQQWAQLCVSCGFEPVAHIRAWLVEERGAQWGLDGELVERRVERKSFFRKLAEAKGSPRIDWEDVLVFRKGAGQ